MTKLRRKRRVDTPRIEWRRRLQIRRQAPLLFGVALIVLLVAGAWGGLRFRPAAQPLPTPTTQALTSLDPQALAVGSLIRQAELLGQVEPAQPSAVRYPTATPIPSPTVWPTRTPVPPTATHTVTPTPTLTPSFIVSEGRLPIVDWEQVSQVRRPVAVGEAAFLEPMAQVYQDDNPNEAPSVAAMLLSFYGLDPDEVLVSAVKKLPYDRESHVALPGDLVRYLEGYTLKAVIYEGVTLEELQALVSNGVPVVVAQSLTPDDKTPHYRVVRGYSDRRGVVMANDSAFAASLSFSYAEFDQMWTQFDGFAMPVFLERQEPVVRAILGEEGDKTAEYVEHDRKLGGPPIETVTPTPTVRTDNSQADAAWTIHAAEVVTGTVLGNAAGAFGYLRFTAPESGKAVTVDMRYTPADPSLARAVGFNVYSGKGDQVGVGANTSGRGGERSLSLTSIAGMSYLVQVYNYLPNLTLAYTLTVSIEGVEATATPSPVGETRANPKPVPTRAITPASGPTSAPAPTQPPPPPTSAPAPTSAPQPTEAPRLYPRPTRAP